MNAEQANTRATAPAAPVVTGARTGQTQVNLLPTLEELLGRPVTAAEVRAIVQRSSTLSSQLQSVQGRRDEVANQLSATTDQAVRAGLEQRLKVLDDRLASMEVDIATNSRLRAAIPPNFQQQSSTQESRSVSPIDGLSQNGFIAITIVFTIVVLGPLAIASAIRLLRRPKVAPKDPQAMAQTERMERIEQAIDAVAIEVERISEGQRFVTQLMTRQNAPALTVGRDGE